MFECLIVLNTKNYSRKVRDTRAEHYINENDVIHSTMCRSEPLFYLMVH